jgi:hypothetical protein
MWSLQERAAIIEYSENDVTVLARLLPSMRPRLTGLGPCCGVATWQRPQGSSPTACRSIIGLRFGYFAQVSLHLPLPIARIDPQYG